MGRPNRAAAGGIVYHVLNRANARMRIFHDPDDYAAFLRVLEQAVERFDVRLLAYCVMPNHWHLVLWPKKDGELSRFMGWLTLTHTQRWHAQRQNIGSGHLYQGRFKSFPVQDDEHFLAVCRYVERNPLRADLVRRSEAWKWSSLYRWQKGTASEKKLLATWPVARRPGWVQHVNAPQTKAEVEAIQQCIQRGRPLGDPAWRDKMVAKLDLESTIRPRGRPRKEPSGDGKGS